MTRPRVSDDVPRARPSRLFAACLPLLLLAAACSSFDERFHFWRKDPLSDSYLAALEKWTRETSVPQDLTLRLGLSATLVSTEFRTDLDAETRRLLGLDASAPSPLLAPPVPGGADIVVAVAAPNEREMALEAKDPFWNLLVIDPKGGRWKPARIGRIDDRAPDRRLFPFHDSWSRLYLVSFPAEVAHAPGSGTLTLEATGVYGRAQVSWTL